MLVMIMGLRPIIRLWDLVPLGGLPSMGDFLRDPSPYLHEFRKKTTENSERLGRQALSGIDPGTSHLPALSA